MVTHELPGSMQWLVPLADKDKDGAINEEESRALAEQFGLAARRAHTESGPERP